nr:HAD-IIIA family hydrolase [Anseongella ginsenosidimutans]
MARGLFMEEALLRVKQTLDRLLRKHGVHLDGFYYCPHHVNGTVSRYAMKCTCRKPMPGMLIHGAVKHGADLAASWMIGDILNDVEAGNRAGCRTILINNGNETEWDYRSAKRIPTFIANDMLEAARLISTSIMPGYTQTTSAGEQVGT